MTIFLTAVENLCGGAHFKLLGDDAYENIVEWFVDTPPTKEQVLAEVSRLEAEQAANAYKAQRAREYPPIGDQLDALYHAGVFPPEMAAQIEAVKNKYPKGGN